MGRITAKETTMKVLKTLKFSFRGETVEEAKSITAELFADLDAYYTTLIAKEDDEIIRGHLEFKRKLLSASGYDFAVVEKEFRELDEDEVEIYNAFVDQDSSVEDLAFKLHTIRNRITKLHSISEFKNKVMMAKQHSVNKRCRFLEVGRFLLTPECNELKAQWKKDAENGD
jgi:hypothetical protein